MTTGRKIAIVAATLVGVAFLAVVALWAGFYFTMVTTVVTKKSPNRKHTAILKRVDGIDLNFRMSVDGTAVYGSPDFAPQRVDFREQLIWDGRSQMVLLEVAGKRIFGYHAIEKRPLSETELLQVEVTPFDVLRYEGKLPQR